MFVRSALVLVVSLAAALGGCAADNTPDDGEEEVGKSEDHLCNFSGLGDCLRNGGGNACYARHGCGGSNGIPPGPSRCQSQSTYTRATYDSSGGCYCKVAYGGTRDDSAVCTPANVLCTTDCSGRRSCSFVSCQYGTPCGLGLC